MNTQISVIVPVYNVEKYLEKCVDSILAQTFRDFEVILVDDGSPDNCPQICDAYAKRDERVRYIHKENGGLTSARLAGYHESVGKYICFVDSDDFVAPEYLHKMYDAIEGKQADLVMCSYYVGAGENYSICQLPYEAKLYRNNKDIQTLFISALLGSPINGESVRGFVWNKLYRRELIHEICFHSEREYYLEDHIFNLKYFENIRSVCVIDDPLYYYFQNPSSLTSSYREKKWEKYKKLFSFFEQYLCNNSFEYLEDFDSSNFQRICLLDAIDNATRMDYVARARREIKKILQDEQASELIRKTSINGLPLTNQIALILLKSHMYSILYFYRKWRRKKAYQQYAEKKE